MRQANVALSAVHALTISRLLAALAFASIAFQRFPLLLVASLYLFAAVSDVIDGYMARRLAVTSFFGQVIDLISDKSLTVVSLLYAGARGIALLPLAVIATRDLIVLGLRILVVDGQRLLPTSRMFGGAMAACLWGNTFFLLLTNPTDTFFWIASAVYWLCALVVALNLIARIVVSFHRIKAAASTKE